MKVIIVGGGLLGLSAALELADNGATPVVLEAENKPGGLCSGFEVGGLRAEKYHHFVTAADKNLVTILHRMNLLDELYWAPAKTACLTDKGLVSLSGAMDLLRFPGVPLFQKLRFGFAMNALTGLKNWRPLENVSAVEWIQSKGGADLYDKMWRELFEMKFEKREREIPLSWFWARVRRRISKKQGAADLFGLVQGSLDILVNGLCEKIISFGGAIKTDNPVTKIEPTESGFTVVLKSGETVTGDKVLFTAPLPVLAQAAPALPDDYKNQCLAIEYSGIVNAVFSLSHSLSDYFWINVTKSDLPFTGIIETTKLLESPATHLVYLPRYRPSDHPDFDLDESEILDRYEKGLLGAFPDLEQSAIISRHLFRERLADPYYTLGYSRKIVAHQTPISGLYCFNTAQIYPDTRSADSSIAYGQRAARLILQKT